MKVGEMKADVCDGDEGIGEGRRDEGGGVWWWG